MHRSIIDLQRILFNKLFSSFIPQKKPHAAVIFHLRFAQKNFYAELAEVQSVAEEKSLELDLIESQTNLCDTLYLCELCVKPTLSEAKTSYIYGLIFEAEKYKLSAMKYFLPLALLIISTFSKTTTEAQKLALSSFASGLSSPMDIKNGGDNRLFVAERAGRIRIVNENGSVNAIPFLDITSKISSTNCEEGFLGFALSPWFKTDGKLYVNYTDSVGAELFSVIEEYRVSTSDSNFADPVTAMELLRVQQPYCNHNAGNMMFGRDSMLYINFGDGGSGGDPLNNGQNLNTFLGKILRVDIRSSSASQPYQIPASNPFYNDPSTAVKKEIWAYGLRNPFRSSVDRLTGDIWIGDVGQSSREEIDFQPFNTGGANYGWKIMEGTACYTPPSGCSTTGLTLPIYDYPRSNGYSVTGGYVHRSAQSKYLFGMYLFSDFGFQWIDGFRQSGGVISGSVTRLLPGSASPGGPVGYGEDRYGDLYIAYNNLGTIYKISDTSYLRQPKAYFTATAQSATEYLLNGLRGRTATYQWLRNGAPIPGATFPDYLATTSGNYQLVLTNEIGNTDTSDVFSLSPLAVNLLDFYARPVPGRSVRLSWITSSEQNSKGFALQRRLAGETDFTTISYINSKAINGNSSIPLNYEFNDLLPLNSGSKIFYRLRMEDLDSRIAYSNIKVVSAGNGKGYTIYPNPAKGYAVLDLAGVNFPVVVNIYDVVGKKVSTQVANQSQLKLNLTNLKGIYTIEVLSNIESLGTGKLIVQ